MRQVIAFVVALALMVGMVAPAAYAGKSTGANVALGSGWPVTPAREKPAG
jgi:hypothetical protein